VRLRRAATGLLLAISTFFLPATLGGVHPAGQGAPPLMLEWPMLPGESLHGLAQLIYPGDELMQRHFIVAAMRANPATFAEAGADRVFERETMIWLPNLKQLADLSAGSPRHYLRPVLPAMQPRAQGTSSARLRMSTHLEPSQDTQAQPEPSEKRLRLTAARRIRHTHATPAFEPATLSALDTLLARQAMLVAAQKRLEARIAALEAGISRTHAAILGMRARPVNVGRPPPSHSRAPEVRASSASEALPPLTPFHALTALVIVMAGVAGMWLRRRRLHRLSSVPPTPVSPIVSAHQQAENDAMPVVRATGAASLEPSRPQEAAMMVDEIDSVVEEAKVFVALGRVERAIEMLEGYIQAHPRASASPWLYLLDLYRSLNRRDAFVALAKRFHQALNVITPQWETPSQTAMVVPRSLTEFPHILTRLTETWGTMDAQDYLNHLLQDNRGGERQGFSMEVLQEILLLLSILELRDTMPELKPF
jgi:hypothetical protein